MTNPTHHVILCKYGPDIYVDETVQMSSYPGEEGKLDNVVVIQGNVKDYKLTLTKNAIVELRDILNQILLK